MSNVKTRRDALKMSLGVLVGLPAVSALNACTQCSKPAADAPASAPNAAATEAPATDAAPASAPAADAAGSTAATGGDTAGLIAETDPLATGLNYKHDKASVPANLQVEKNGVAFAEQSCANCMFFKAESGDIGACQVIPTGKVKAGGWCSSWSKKA